MIIRDYENNSEYERLEKKYIDNLKILANSDNDDIYYNLFQIIQNNNETKAPINQNAIIYNILTNYAVHRLSKQELTNPQKFYIPYINSVKLNKRLKLVQTPEENINFKLIIDTYPTLITKMIKQRFTLNKLYIELYQGKTIGRCHELCAKYPFINYNIVTAYMPHMFTGLSYIHTFEENENTIIDLSNNLVLDKGFFYKFLKPEVVSKIPSEELYQNLKNHKIHGNLKDYFANYPKQKCR